jgi:hypothetical protein
MTAAEKLRWMQDALWDDDADRFRELRREVEAVAALVQGYPERQADLIGGLYEEMRAVKS